MKIRDYKNEFITRLSPLYDKHEIDSFFNLILENRRQLSRVQLALNPNADFSQEEILDWNSVTLQLQNEIPIQYILGESYFYGLRFMVDSNVLIPRSETEELVSWIVSDTIPEKQLNILDIGTGSGCIAISLAKNIPSASVSAIDISPKALEIAGKNASLNNAVVNFLEVDILAADHLPAMYDVIVSNPPYVRELEKHEIKKNVLDNEPHLALFVDDNDALVFYKKIATLAKSHLNINGTLFFEINQYLANETMEMLESVGFRQLELRQDIYGNDRMIKAKM